MLRYLQYQTACDIAFLWWMLSWFVTRHVLFCKIIASLWWDAPKVIEFAWWPERGHWLTKEVYYGFISLLVTLEVSTGSMVHETANLVFVLDYPEHLVLPDMWSGISRTEG